MSWPSLLGRRRHAPRRARSRKPRSTWTSRTEAQRLLEECVLPAADLHFPRDHRTAPSDDRSAASARTSSSTAASVESGMFDDIFDYSPSRRIRGRRPARRFGRLSSARRARLCAYRLRDYLYWGPVLHRRRRSKTKLKNLPPEPSRERPQALGQHGCRTCLTSGKIVGWFQG